MRNFKVKNSSFFDFFKSKKTRNLTKNPFLGAFSLYVEKAEKPLKTKDGVNNVAANPAKFVIV